MQKITKPTNIDFNAQIQSKSENLHQESFNEQPGPHTLLRNIDDTPMTPTKKTKSSLKPLNALLVSLAVILSGTITGFGLHKVMGSSVLPGSVEDGVTGVEQGSGIIENGTINVGQTLGNPEKTGDSTEGVLVAGGINGEGSHRILRPGGPTKTVYVTSSVIDLTQLEGHKIKVWGETFSAQSAGWLMDVVTVEVLELNAPMPFQEN